MVETTVLTNSLLKSVGADMMCYRNGVQSMDFNDITSPGVYLVTKAAEMANNPGIKSNYGDLIVYPGYYGVQEFQPTTSDVFYRRQRVGSLWRPWVKYSGEIVT